MWAPACSKLPIAAMRTEPAAPADWQSLGTPREELTLDFTLPTGQSFRWRKSGEAEYTGVVQQRLVRLRQEEDDVSWQVLARTADASPQRDSEVLREYFNLHECLADRCRDWATKDARFRLIHTHFPGARMLRQPPLECLFQFICSSNNHISRIHGMVERLCSAYGTPLEQKSPASLYPTAQSGNQTSFYAFPTLEELESATEEDLRSAGFGYRAKFIVGSVAALLQKPEGGQHWLEQLRTVPYKDAVQALVTLPGIGPKDRAQGKVVVQVAACVCLFSLDKHEAIPVDTHVWQLAAKYYTPGLKGKTLTPKLMAEVEAAFIGRFGPYAGWAHNVLFISDLKSQEHNLPPALRPRESVGKKRGGENAGVSDGTAAKKRRTVKSEVLATGVKAEAVGGSENGSEAVGVHVKKTRTRSGQRVTVTAAAKPVQMRRQQAIEDS